MRIGVARPRTVVHARGLTVRQGYDLTRTTVLDAVVPASIAFTQPAGATVAGSGVAHPVDVMSRSVAVTVTLKYVVFFGFWAPDFVNEPDDDVVSVAVF